MAKCPICKKEIRPDGYCSENPDREEPKPIFTVKNTDIDFGDLDSWDPWQNDLDYTR